MNTTQNPLLSAFVSSARFAGRRTAARFAKPPEIETLIVDVDRTLTREDSPKLALEALCGKAEANRVFHSIVRSAVLGRIPVESINGEVFGELYKRGFRRADWVRIMEEQERDGGLRLDLIEAILTLSNRHGITTVLATRSSEDAALWLAHRFGFGHAIGSRERINGSFDGFFRMIGVVDGIHQGTEVLTKITAASRLLAEGGRTLVPERTAVLSNDLLDAFEMLASAKGVLLVPTKMNTLERLTGAFRLYDEKVQDGPDIGPQLYAALGFGRN
ncbi:haloacid dehalogenase-like hydrolase [Candidatus Micrarchaeota archaeon]|nr:haloacid dehalogenase-like hydrolase [Candidatus Micrarchaeota archaeon]